MSTLNYYVGTTTATQTLSAFTQTPSCDFTITYTAKKSDGSALPTFISFNGVNSFSISTSSFGDLGSYSILITGTLTDDIGVKTQTTTWTVNILTLCNTMTITTTAVADQVYVIYSSS